MKIKKKLVCGQNCLVSIFREKMADHMIKIYKLFNVGILGIARSAKLLLVLNAFDNEFPICVLIMGREEIQST